MALEDLTGSKFISDLVITNPVGSTDLKSTLDDHLRGIKNVLQNQFPNLNAAVNASDEELNAVVGLVTELGLLSGLLATAAELNILDGATLTVAELNFVVGVTSAIQTQINLLTTKGADIVSANDTVLLADGNYNDIIGTTTINGMTDGVINEVRKFHFDSAVLLKHNTAASAGFSSLFLPNAIDYTTIANDELEFVYDSALWRLSGSNFYSAVAIANGTGNAPSIQTAGLADGLITNIKHFAAVAGSALLFDGVTYGDAGSTVTTPTKVAEVYTPLHGTVSVDYNYSTSLGGWTTYAQLYINGVAKGVQRSSTVTTKTRAAVESFAVVGGDLIQIYAWNLTGNAYSAKGGEIRVFEGGNPRVFYDTI